MNERFTRLFLLPENLYTIGSPVIIKAGAILKDNQTDKALIQIKFKSICQKKIKGLKVIISPYDTIGKSLGDSFSYQYLDFMISRNEEFGQKTAIPLPDNTTRRFSCTVMEVYMDDNTVWSGSNEGWEYLHSPNTLFKAFSDDELVKQFKLQYGNNSEFMFFQEKDLWTCPCGAINRNSENECHYCKKSYHELLLFDFTLLSEDCNQRLKQEAAEQEEARIAAEKAAEEKRIELAERTAKEKELALIKKKKIKKTGIIVLAIIVFLIASYFFTLKFIIPYTHYLKAEVLMEESDYNGAKIIYWDLDGFMDSENKIVIIRTLSNIDVLIARNTTLNTSTTDLIKLISKILDSGKPVQILYDTDSGTISGGNEYIYNSSSEFSEFKVPERQGYQFAGWELVSYKYISKTFISILLKATWNGTYSILYELDGGLADNPDKYDKDGVTITLTNPKKNGYTFIGWTGADLLSPTKDVAIVSGSYGDRSYIANWEANKYTITLNSNGGTLAASSYVVTYEQDFSLPIPQKANHTFVGWYNGNTIVNDGIWNKDAGSTLSARWELTKYNISYNLNGGINATTNPQNFTIETPKITLNMPTKAGYKFQGWYTDNSFTNPIAFIEQGTNRNVSVYSKWELVTYSLNYSLNGGTLNEAIKTSFTINDLPYKLPVPQRSGYTFSGWYSDNVKISDITQQKLSNSSLSAKWEPITYKITYYLNGGINSSSNPNSYAIDTLVYLLAPGRTGYKFIGWYTDSSFTNPIMSISKGTNKDIILFAKWEMATYAISYSLNGGSLSNTPVISYTINDLPIKLPEPQRSGYTFSGWYNGSTKVIEITQQQASNLNLSAQWALTTFKIIYNLDGGINSSSNPISFAANMSNITLNAPTRNGYKFQGWYIDEAYKNAITSIDKGTNKDITLYAKWELEIYTISLSLNGGTMSGSTTIYYTTDNLPLKLPEPTKGGAKFACWYKDSLSGQAIPGQITKCENLNLYAAYIDKLLDLQLVDNSYYRVTSYRGNENSVIIPAYFDGKEIKEIATVAFANNTRIEFVTLPYTIKEIGSMAFMGCSVLLGVNIPEGVTALKHGLFTNCTRLIGIGFPSTLTKIESEAFSGCSGLKYINIPSSVTEIQERAFFYCNNILVINIDEGLKKIGLNVFAYCTSLEKIIIPKSVEEIESSFIGCENLIIHCRSNVIPSTWSRDWSSNHSYILGYTGD